MNPNDRLNEAAQTPVPETVLQPGTIDIAAMSDDWIKARVYELVVASNQNNAAIRQLEGELARRLAEEKKS